MEQTNEVSSSSSQDVKVDLDTGQVFKNEKEIKLPDRAKRILKALATEPGKFFASSELARLLSIGTKILIPADVANAIHRLRRAIEDDPSVPKHVITMRNGYKFV